MRKKFSILLYSRKSFGTLRKMFSSIEEINRMIERYNAEYLKEYKILEKDIIMFKEVVYHINAVLTPNTIEYLCEKKKFNVTEQLKSEKNRAFLTKILIMITGCADDFSKEFRINYSEIILLGYKFIKKLFLDDILEDKEIISIVNFRIILSLFKKELFEDKNDFQLKKDSKCLNLLLIWATIKFLSSFSKEDLTEKKKKELEIIIIRTLSFFDSLCLSNFNNINALSDNAKMLQLLDLCSISDKVSYVIINLLVKIYKNNFKIKWLYHTLNEHFFSLKNNSKYITKKTVRANCNSMNSQIVFLKKLLKEEKDNLEKENVFIPNGFFFNPYFFSGILSTDIKSFPKSGYSSVVSFRLMVSENNKLDPLMKEKKFTIFAFFFQNITFHLYIEDFQLKLKFKDLPQTICKVEPNKNYVLWLFQGEGSFARSPELIAFVNQEKFTLKGFSFQKDSFKISIGARKNFPNDPAADCFEGIIGTFILFDHCLIKEKSEKESSLLSLKGYYENIIYANCDRSFYSHFEPTAPESFKKKIKVIISSKSIGKFKNFKEKNGKVSLLFNTVYFDRESKSDDSEMSIKYQTRVPPDILNLLVYPFERTDTLTVFINNNGLMFLQLHLFYYIKLNEKHFQMISQSINSYLSNIIELIFFCLANYKEKNFTIIEKKELDNVLYTIKHFVDRNLKMGIKFEENFIQPFTDYFCLIIESKKLLKCTLFLLNYEYYDKENSKGLSNFFKYLAKDIEKIYEKFLSSKDTFEKILSFESVYSTNQTFLINSFSELMQNILKTIIKNKDNFNLIQVYLDHLIKKKGKISNINTEEDLSNSDLLNLLELYRALRNFYVSIVNDEKMKTFVQMLKEKGNIFKDFKNFFKDLLKDTNEIFRKMLCTPTLNDTEDHSLIEMIKSICILFTIDFIYINDFILEDRIKEKSGFFGFFSGRKKSSRKVSSQGDLLHFSSMKTLANKDDDEFREYKELFDFIYPTPYNFRAVFLTIFRDMKYEDKINFVEKEKERTIPNVPPSIDGIKDTEAKNFQYCLQIILRFFDKLEDVLKEEDTIFCSNFQLIEFAYKMIFDFLNEFLKYYIGVNEEMKSKIKMKLNLVFENKECCYILYNKLLNSSIINENESVSDARLMDNTKKIEPTDKEEFERMVCTDIKEIIERTIFIVKDPFYFQLLPNLLSFYSLPKLKNFVLDCIETMIIEIENWEGNVKKTIEGLPYEDNDSENCYYINNKNLLILIYKLLFVPKNKDFIINNPSKLNRIVLYLNTLPQNEKLLWLRCLFKVDENNFCNVNSGKSLLEEKEFQCLNNNSNRNHSFGKLFIEMLYDICIFLYFTSLEKKTENLNIVMLQDLLKNLLIKEPRIKNSCGKTFCYKIDEQTFSDKSSISNNENLQKVKELENYINKKNFIKLSSRSVTILFLIKVLADHDSIKKKIQKDNSLSLFLISLAEILYGEARKITIGRKNLNSIISEEQNVSPLYYSIKDYIEKTKNNKVITKKEVEEIQKKITNDESECRKFKFDGYYNGKNLIPGTNSASCGYNYLIRESISSSGDPNESRRNLGSTANLKNSAHSSLRFSESKINYTILENRKNQSKSEMNLNNYLMRKKKKTVNDTIEIETYFEFKKDFLKKNFAIYFINFHTYDEEFVKIKQLYKYKYGKEIKNIDKFSVNYPVKIKNYVNSNYSRCFLEHDFKFESSDKLHMTHSFIDEFKYNYNYELNFPVISSSRDLKRIDSFDNKEEETIFKTELITPKGTIYGILITFKNCLFFHSDSDNDRRGTGEMETVFCSLENDFIKKKKDIIIPYEDIKEVLTKRFVYMFIALEFTLKNGKNYFFNLFAADKRKKMLSFLAQKKIEVIDDNPSEYFRKKEYTEKWNVGEISTYDYLLLLNKFSLRTYMDPNQYLIFPWIKKSDMSTRDFSVPISLQSEERKKEFEAISNDKNGDENRHHGNHYSTNAYVIYYLMRINPFTDNMIEFQSNRFDEPDRQFTKIESTLKICETFKDNREMIPDLFSFPEIFFNLNCNDFGKQGPPSNKRVHDVDTNPFGINGIDFTYRIKRMINTDGDVNSKISDWIDYVFGVKQYYQDNLTGKGFTNFQKYCYSQNINFDKKRSDAIREKKSKGVLYDEIRRDILLIINLGQTPHRLLQYKLTPKKETPENPQDKNTELEVNLQEKQRKYFFFTESITKNYLYCMSNPSKRKEKGESNETYLEIYDKTRNFTHRMKLPHCNLLNKTPEKNLIYRPKYLICELKEMLFVSCRYLDNTIKITSQNISKNVMLESFATSILAVTRTEFVIGLYNGIIIHFEITDPKELKLNLKKKIISNDDFITALFYSEKMNVLVSCDTTSVILRNFYSFEYLGYVKIKPKEKKQKVTVVDVKISSYDLMYILYNVEKSEEFILSGYTVNGIYFGEKSGRFVNFDFTNQGNLICGYNNDNESIITVLDPVNFNTLFTKKLDFVGGLFYFNFDPSSFCLNYGYVENDIYHIKKLTINEKIKKFFE